MAIPGLLTHRVSRMATLVLLLALLAAAPACKSKHDGKAEATPSPSPPSVDVARVASRSVPQVIPLVGTVTADNPVNVDPRVGGRVVAVMADVGDLVRKGQVLVRLDDTDARLQLAQDQAALTQSLARLGLKSPGEKLKNKNSVPGVKKALAAVTYQKENYDRYQDLRKQELVSDSEVQNARQLYVGAVADYEASLQQVDQDLAAVSISEEKVAQDQQQLAYYQIVAPIDGAVQQRNVSPGDVMSSGQPALVLVDVERLYLAVDVPETYVPQVGVGKVFEGTTGTVPPQKIRARIVQVSPILNAQTRTLQAKALIETGTAGAKPGMFVTIRFLTGVEQDRLLVPQASVLSEAGVARLFVLKQVGQGWEADDRKVDTGDTLGDWVEVTGDLKAGDHVAASNLAALKDKAPVQIGKELPPPPASGD